MSALDLLIALSVLGLAGDIGGHVSKNITVMWFGRVLLWLSVIGWIGVGILMYLIAASFSSGATAGH